MLSVSSDDGDRAEFYLLLTTDDGTEWRQSFNVPRSGAPRSAAAGGASAAVPVRLPFEQFKRVAEDGVSERASERASERERESGEREREEAERERRRRERRAATGDAREQRSRALPPLRSRRSIEP